MNAFPIDSRRLKFSDQAAYAAFSGSASYNQAREFLYTGRLSEHDWAWFSLLWEWTAVRLSSAAQDRFYARVGRERFYRRIERARTLQQRLMASRFGYCAVAGD